MPMRIGDFVLAIFLRHVRPTWHSPTPLRHGRCRIRHRTRRQPGIHHCESRSPLQVRHQGPTEIPGSPEARSHPRCPAAGYPPPLLRFPKYSPEVMCQHGRVPAAALRICLRSPKHLPHKIRRVLRMVRRHFAEQRPQQFVSDTRS